MKRFSLSILGLMWGLFITWASIYTSNHIHWPETPARTTGCNDMEHCASHTTFVWGLLAMLLWPAIAFAVLNAVAYNRWSARNWGISFGGLTLLVALFYLAPYFVPALKHAG